MLERQSAKIRLTRAFQGQAQRLYPFFRRHAYRGPLLPSEVESRVAVSLRDGFLYNRIPKTANSLMTWMLATASARAAGEPAPDRPKSYFPTPRRLSSAEVARVEQEVFKFAIVRNPYSRTLSAYLDKIAARKRQARTFERWRGAPVQRKEPSFGEFCRYLDAGGLRDDVHWAPQTELLCEVPGWFDRIYRQEKLGEAAEEIMGRIFGVAPEFPARVGPRPTGASKLVARHYDDETRRIVARLFAADFDALGYAPELPGAA